LIKTWELITSDAAAYARRKQSSTTPLYKSAEVEHTDIYQSMILFMIIAGMY
jgi:hypothetical protein